MKTRFFFVLLAVIVALSLTGVALAQEPAGDFAVVQQAADNYLSSGKAPVMSADQLFETLNDGDPSNDPFILSVRRAEHYAAGHIPGAVNIPWKNVAESDNLAKLPMDKQIVVYCYTGHTGQIATTALSLLGYDAVNLKFGMMGWTKDDDVLATSRFDPATQADYMLETETHEAMETYDFPQLSTGGTDDFEIVRIAVDNWLKNAEAPIVSVDSVFENLNDGDAMNDPVVLSVRSPDHYALGHVPGAMNIPWRNLAKPENLAKLPAGKRIVAYCYTGHTGMVSATILGVLGYDVGNMKFGMMAWTKDDEVLATGRFDPVTQPDYMLEASALPVTGGDLTTAWMVFIGAGLAALGAGLALRRRVVAA